MFDINVYFENFKDKEGYEELSKILKTDSEVYHDGTFLTVQIILIPKLEFKPELNAFPDKLKDYGWNDFDIDMVKIGIKLYKVKDRNSDLEAYALCNMCKDLFPEKTELFDLIIEDLEKGTDNRDRYVDLFDLQSDIVNTILYYMS